MVSNALVKSNIAILICLLFSISLAQSLTAENQLRDTQVLLSEPMLFRCEDIIVFKVTRDVRMNNVF